MKLFFCDICNESIPLQDIKEAKSATIKGKIFCHKCNPLNELGPTESSSKSGSGPAGLLSLVVVLLILVIGGLGYVIYDLKFAPEEVAGEKVAGDDGLVASQLREMHARITTMEGQIAEMAALQAVPALVSALQVDTASTATAQTQLFKDVSQLQEGLVAVGRLRERLDGMSLRLEELAQDGGRTIEALKQLEGLVAQVQEAAVNPGAGSSTAEEAGAGEVAGEVELDKEVLAVLEKLNATDPMARWEAVDQIRRRQDKSLVPRVLPLLDDRDTFVRTQAIYTLGELKAMSAVPKLVKLLRDDEIMIREEALTSLVVITGQNFKFDVTGSRSVREKGIKKWEEWLTKNEDKF